LAKSNGGKLSRRDVFKMAVAATASMQAGKARAEEAHPVQSAESRRAERGPAQARNTRARRSGRPNILLIMADQHRGDCLGCDGNRAIRTPNLDALAREGVRFRNAYTATPSCIPARAGLLTGLSPWNHGLLGMDGWPIATKYRHEMPKELGKAGYYTAAIGKNHFDPSRQSHGYDLMLSDEHQDLCNIYQTDYHSWFWMHAANIKGPADAVGNSDAVDGCGFGWKDFWNAYDARAFPYPERLHRTRWVGRSAVNFLRTYDRRQPFFLKVSFIPPHSPYIPPERLMRQYMDADLPPAFHAAWAEKYRPRSGPGLDIWHGDLGTEQVRRSRAGYYGQVTYVDEQIGQILEELDSRGMMEDTLIVYTSDHGDMLGDHFMWRKCQPYQSSVRIPMLMRWPKGLVSARRGRVVDQPTELRDLMPTFLDAARALEPVADSLDGLSLLRLADAKTEGWRPYIDMEHDICYSPLVHWNALTDGHVKYIFHAHDGSEQMFDLDNDPQEMHDLAAESAHQGQLKTWRARMVKHLEVRGDQWVKDGKLMLRRESFPISPNYPREEAKRAGLVQV
jgi:arylsulfatase